jgi:hypothetical protein
MRPPDDGLTLEEPMTITIEQWDAATIEQRAEWLRDHVELDEDGKKRLICREKYKRDFAASVYYQMQTLDSPHNDDPR